MQYKIKSTGEIIVADLAFVEANFPGDFDEVPEELAAEPVTTVARLISVGAFFDRFGPAKWAILADTSPNVQAVVKDSSVRKHIDLDNPDLPTGLAIVSAAGHAIDASKIISEPVIGSELP